MTHPVKTEDASGVAVRVTAVFGAYASVQSAGHEMPAGLLVTVPEPEPDDDTVDTVRVYVCGALVNAAVTSVSAFRTTVQVPVPEQPPPDQPENTEPNEGVAVRTTLLPPAYASVQSEPQLIPAGLLEMVPAPVPVFSTDSAYAPAPLNGATRSGVNGSLVEMTIIPERYPPVVGEKVATSVQLVPGAMVGVRLEQGAIPPGVTLNWGGVVVIEETARSSVPALASRNSFGVDVLPTGTSPKL
jgi:hypothetical protein